MPSDIHAPVFDNQTNFETYRREVDIWLLGTGCPKEKQAARLALQMKGRAKEVALGVPTDQLKSEDGVNLLLEAIRKVFGRDKTVSLFSAIEAFENFIRPANQNMSDFISEFSTRLGELRQQAGVDDHRKLYGSQVLAYRLLEQANISDEQKRLLRATCVEISLECMITQMKRAYGETLPSAAETDQNSETLTLVVCYNCKKEGHIASECYNRRGAVRGKRGGGRGQRGSGGRRGQSGDATGVYKMSVETDYVLSLSEQVGLRALLDTGAAKSVCGSDWLKNFEKESCIRVRRESCEQRRFTFGDLSGVNSTLIAYIPTDIFGVKFTEFAVYVLDINIPLLLSRHLLSQMNAVIDFERDQLRVSGKTTPLHLTDTGHVTIDLNQKLSPTTLLTNSCSGISPPAIAKKLHKYFAHGSVSKIQDIVKSSDHPRKSEICQELTRVTQECENCLEHSASKPRRKVALPLSKTFNECLATDLKMLKFKSGESCWVLHIIDTLTRYSVMVPVKSKTGSEITQKFFTNWISIFGRPQRILSDNGGEFINDTLLEMASRLGIELKSTPAESPWCNGICERHNSILGKMVEKTKDDTKCSIAVACAWASNAKNQLTNQMGFSPHQLVFGSNPTIPSVLNDDCLPAHGSQWSEDQVISDNITAMKTAREKFIQLENASRLKRALASSGPTQDQTTYVQGDKVYYKREQHKTWLGPATVVGMTENQVLIKHGGQLLRAHPCKVRLVQQRQEPPEDQQRKEEYKRKEESSSKRHVPEMQIAPEETTDEDVPEPMEKSKLQPPKASRPRRPKKAVRVPTRKYNLRHNRRQNPPPEHPADELLIPSETDPEEDTPQDGHSESNIEEVPRELTYAEIAVPTEDQQEEEATTSGPVVVRVPESETNPDTEDTPGQRAIEPDPTEDITRSNEDNTDPKEDTTEPTEDKDKTQEDKDKTQEDKDKTPDQDTEDSDPDSDTEEIILLATSKLGKEEVQTARNREIDKLREFNVFEEVPDTGQQPVTTRWVMTRKDDGTVKARLVARGFEEKLEDPTNSPTVTKHAVRILLSLATTSNWTLKSVDVTSAYLQSDNMTRDVFIKPPAYLKRKDVLWKLNKPLYGLGDAGRRWYMSLTATLKNTLQMSRIDKNVFFTTGDDGKLQGLLVIHVDDILITGDHNFYKKVKPALDNYKIGRVETTEFNYLGWQLKQQGIDICVTQEQYCKFIREDILDKMKAVKPVPQNQEEVDENLQSYMRTVIGKLNWLATQSMPQISFSLLDITTKSPWTGKEFKELKKIVTNLSPSTITFSPFNPITAEITVYTDASLGNLADRKSGAGVVVFWGDSSDFNLIAYSCGKVKRVVKSVFAAELYAVSEGLGYGVMIKALLQELSFDPPIRLFTDSAQVVSLANSVSAVPTDKGSILELREVQEKVEKGEASINWVESKSNPADVLTKRGVSPRVIERMI